MKKKIPNHDSQTMQVHSLENMSFFQRIVEGKLHDVRGQVEMLDRLQRCHETPSSYVMLNLIETNEEHLLFITCALHQCHAWSTYQLTVSQAKGVIQLEKQIKDLENNVHKVLYMVEYIKRRDAKKEATESLNCEIYTNTNDYVKINNIQQN